MYLLSFFRQHRILSGAVVLALTQCGASVAGLMRDRLLARTFPGLDVVDVYIAAFRPGDLLFQMLIMSAVGTVLVPMLTRHSVKNDHKEVADLLGAAIGMGSLVFGVIAIITAIILPTIAPHIVGFRGDALTLYVNFGRIVLLSDLLMVIGNVAGQYLIAVERYWIYGLTPIIYSLGTIFGTVFLTVRLGPYGPIVGTVLGAVFYALWRLIAVFWSGLPLRLRLSHPNIADMGWLMLPRMAALGALQLQLLVFDFFASHLSFGAVTVNAYARNFQSVVVGAIGISIAQAAFASMSRAAAHRKIDMFTHTVTLSLILLSIVTIPAAALLVLLTPFAASLVHLTQVLPFFGGSLMLYAVSIPFESANHVLLRAYYALHRTDIPAVMTVGSSVFSIVFAAVLLPTMGILSLPMGFVGGQVLQLVGLGLCLRPILRKGEGEEYVAT